MTKIEKRVIFEEMPIPKAVATLAVPTILSQIITMIYNLADTFFIGQMGNPYMVAAVSLVYPVYHLLTSFSNLFGVGGGSLISRLMGEGKPQEAGRVSSFSLYMGGLTALNVLHSYMFQSVGKGTHSTILMVVRQAVLNIPLMLLMSRLFGLYGLIWTQFVMEAIVFPVFYFIYRKQIQIN